MDSTYEIVLNFDGWNRIMRDGKAVASLDAE